MAKATTPDNKISISELDVVLIAAIVLGWPNVVLLFQYSKQKQENSRPMLFVEKIFTVALFLGLCVCFGGG